MTTFERIKKLADNQKISLKDLALKLGFGENYFYNMKNAKSSPSSEILTKVADYFGVTVDSLLGREDKINDGIKNPEIRILARQLDKEFDADQIEEFKSFAQYLRHKKFGGEKDGEL
ncbi:helix-turn-helix domain-containing protein [Lactococcus lactis subsp. cremoris]|nr:helix-turn-helix transcriptional regulator [Lactococcus cremoris]MRM77601.1 helix-turn-helix domain-containing protein [Lactococcus cremoris]